MGRAIGSRMRSIVALGAMMLAIGLFLWPRAAFASTTAEELGAVANRYIQEVSLMQPNVNGSGDCSWDSKLHCFSSTPSADDAFIIGWCDGVWDDLYHGEHYVEEDESDRIPREILEQRLSRCFSSVPDLRDRIPYPWFSSITYEPSEDALIFPDILGKGLQSLVTEMKFCTEVRSGVYDVYMKVILDRWTESPDLSDPSQYVVHRLRVQYAGEDWKYLAFDLVDHDVTGSVPIKVENSSGFDFKGDLEGFGHGIISLVVDKLDKASYEEKFRPIPNLLDVFAINLNVDGAETHDGFGTLKIDFPVGYDLDGYWIVIHHLHENGKVTQHRVIAKDGFASLDVTDLSSFALEKGLKATTVGESADSADDPTSAADRFLEILDAPADGTQAMSSPKTGQPPIASGLAIGTLSILMLLAFVSLRVARKRASDQ